MRTTSSSVSYRTTGTSAGQFSPGSQSGCGANHHVSSGIPRGYAGRSSCTPRRARLSRTLSEMKADEYRAFTRELTERLRADERAIGLVAVGSMADRDYAPDEWSDHDFLVITRAGAQEEVRNDLSWLPNGERIALSLRETDHGLIVIYDDGHLLEFAVFDLEEIALAGVNRSHVLLDRGGVAERIAHVAANP